MSSSSFSPLLQLFSSQLSLWPLPLLSFLLSGLYTQPNITLPLLLVGAGAAAAPHVSAASCYDRYIEDVAWTRVKGMMSTIGCAKVVSVSASCSRCYSLTQSSLFPLVLHMFLYSCMSRCLSSIQYIQHSQILVSVRFTTCYTHPLTPLKSLPQLQPKLQLKVITHLLLLLFKHISVILRNVGGSGGRHGNTRVKMKNFFSIYVLLTQVLSQDFWINSIGLQRLSPKRRILSYASPPIQKLHSMVISSPNYTSLPSMVAIFFATHLIVVLQPSRYSIFYGIDILI